MLKPNELYRSLGEWKPPGQDLYLASLNYTDTLKGDFIKAYSWLSGDFLDVRPPLKELDEKVKEWHHDQIAPGGGEIDSNYPAELLSWSNLTGTVIKLPDGQIIEAKPYEILVFNNRKLEHRAPANWADPSRVLLRGASLEGFIDKRVGEDASNTNDSIDRRAA